jgi:hypothetical protein
MPEASIPISPTSGDAHAPLPAAFVDGLPDASEVSAGHCAGTVALVPVEVGSDTTPAAEATTEAVAKSSVHMAGTLIGHACDTDAEQIGAMISAEPKLAQLLAQVLALGTEECQRLEAIASAAVADVEKFCITLEASENTCALTKRALAKREFELAALQADEHASRQSADVAKRRAAECERRFAALTKVHDARALRLQRLRRASSEHRRRTRHTTAQLAAVRRRSSIKASQLRAEKEQLVVWSNELAAWWEAQVAEHGTSFAAPSALHCASTSTVGEEDESEDEDEEKEEQEDFPELELGTCPIQRLPVGDRDDVLATATLIEENVVAAMSETFPPEQYNIKPTCQELDPRLMPNLSRSSRRIARGGHAPSKIQSFFKQWTPGLKPRIP